MKILFITRSSLFSNPGGDTVQVLQTARALRKSGVEVDVRLTNEAMDYDAFDLLHFFNLTRPADILLHAFRSGKPYLLTPIFIDYTSYDRHVRTGLSGSIFRMLGPGSIEYAKVIGRAVMNRERIISPEYIWRGQAASMKKLASGAAMVLPNSESEFRRLVHFLGFAPAYRIIPNAIDPEIFYPGNLPKDPRLVLCAGRIEGLKNQLSLIRALNHTSFRLLIIGNASRNHYSYYRQCREEAASNVAFLPALPQEKLAAFYAEASIHVLPSWFETTGLSSLEAAAMGCRIVITDKGDAREYFGKNAFYCDPGDISSIRLAVEDAALHEKDSSLTEWIHREYTWRVAAEKTKDAYSMILEKEGVCA